MNRLFNNKRKKSPESFPQPTFPTMPTDVATGLVSHQTQSNFSLEDEGSGGDSRIDLRNRVDEDQELPAPVARTSGVVIGGIQRGNNYEDTGYAGGRISESAGASRVAKKARKGAVLEGFTIHDDAAKEATEGFGPLKVVLGSIPALCANLERTITIGNKIEDLLSRMVAVEARFATLPGDVEEQRLRHELIRLKVIEEQLRLLCEKPGLQRLGDRIQDDESVLGLLEDLKETISDYQRVQQVANYEQGCRAMDPAESSVLNQFRSAKEAEHRHTERRGCLKGTRRDILDEIEYWSRDFDKPPVYWLNGLAGTGKTTIAQTIAERFFADDQLGASFFCSRDFEDRSNLHFIFPTLAVQLARRYIGFRSIFVPLARSDPGIAYESLYNQMNKLIVRPLIESAISTVIVIDALDECKDEESTSAILSVLGQFVSQIPKVKILVTGRPEPRIREGFRVPLLAQATDVFVLHEVESDRVNSDIRLFFKHRLSGLAAHRYRLANWPTEGQLDLLCGRAAGLFVYAVATVGFINHRKNSPKKQLDRLLQSPGTSVFEGKTRFTTNTTLDSLYTSILRDAFGDDDPEDDAKVRSVLGAVILAANPISPSAIATLLGLDIDEVFPLLSLFHSLLTLQEDVDQVVRPFHKSFPDFIVDSARCTNSRFRVSPPDQHAELLVSCLELMNQNLERNMCKLPDGAINSDVDDLKERTEQYIPQALRYACTSWHKHLVDATLAHRLKITSVLHHFLERKFLFWLEALSVLDVAREAVDALEVTAKWLNVSPTLDLVNDYSRFVIGFFEIIKISASHIYRSALPLSPRESIVHKVHKPYVQPLPRVVRGSPISWESTVATVRHTGEVEHVAWSSCNRFIAVALEETTEILDAATLERLHTFTPPSSRGIRLLSFSPDSRSLTQFTSDAKHTTWDLQTGGQISVIPLAPNALNLPHFSSAYSMDGRIVGVACGDRDDSDWNDPNIGFISTYNLSGTHIYSHRVSEGRIVAPIWTHGDFLRFITVKGRSITIWEVGFTSEHTLAEIETLPAPDDYIDPENCLFLPTRTRLAYILNNEAVLIWDARDSKFLLNFVGDNRSEQLSFSSDGRFFACDVAGEIHLWKEFPTGYVLHQTLTYSIDTSFLTQLLLSPNGESIIKSDDSGIRLWRTTDQITSLPIIPTQSHNKSHFILAFSPDRSLAATAQLGDNTATIIDLKSGDPRLIIDTGMEIDSLGVNANTVVVVSDGKIVTWDLPTGDCVLNATANIHDSVRTIVLNHPDPPPSWFHSVSVSPDLDCFIIIRESCNKLDLYDMSTEKHVCTTSGVGYGTWFTRDGCEVWSSRDKLMKGWKIVKGGNSDVIGLEPLGPNAKPSGVYHWESSHGRDVTDDGWILDSRKKRVMWLPHRWRVDEEDRIWGGRFLGLFDGELPEPVILELDE